MFDMRFVINNNDLDVEFVFYKKLIFFSIILFNAKVEYK